MSKPFRVDLDAHTITCVTCGSQQKSQDISRTTQESMLNVASRYAREHRCGASITARASTNRVHLPELGADPWRAAWQKYEANHAAQ